VSHPEYIAVTWIFNKGTIKNAPYLEGSNVLFVESAQFQMDGRYSCFGLEVHRYVKSYFISHADLVVLGNVLGLVNYF